MSLSTTSPTSISRQPSIWTTGYEDGTFAKISGIKYRQRSDEGALARLGKQQELRRRFGFLSIFGFSCCILVTWETALVLSQEALSNGGPAGVAWGYPLAWVCSISVYMCLAEMASIAPIAGGQYFWVAILSPPRYKRFLSYVTGWLTSLAWVATIGIGMIIVGTLIEGMVVLDNPGYHKESWQSTLFCWAVIALATFINVFLAGILPFLEGMILIIHILGFVAVMITVVYLTPKVSARDVFFKALNLGDWSSQGLSFCVGFTGNVATFVGADAAVHMSEEIENAAIHVPWAILTTLLINGSMGYCVLLALLFSMTDIEDAINTNTGYPFIEVFAHGCGKPAATVLTAIITAMIWCAVIGFLATASRMMWSFARDKAVPFHSTLRKVHTSSAIPLYTVALAAVIPCFLALIVLGSPVAYQDVLSMSVSGLYASYLIPCTLLFWRRVTGQIQPYDRAEFTNGEKQIIHSEPVLEGNEILVKFTLMWGPWKVPGMFGTLNNAFACTYCCFVLFWSFWPSQVNPPADKMNYAVVSFVAVTGFSIVYYFIYGHRVYKGPLVELGPRRDMSNDEQALDFSHTCSGTVVS